MRAGNIVTAISDHLIQFLAIPSKETPVLSTDIMNQSLWISGFYATKFKNELSETN